MQPLSRQSQAQSGAITVKEQEMRQQKMHHSRQRADSVCSISKTQNGNANAENTRLGEANQLNLVSPLNKNNLIGLAALTPMEIDQRN